ncbi:MAG: universal stress protein [Bacteroidales bacterium]|nr:universal stress protein [Bacteroidales bacterium]
MKKTQIKILVPTDFSEQSNLALHQAIHYAELINAQITLLYVLHEKKGILGSIFNKQQEKVFDTAILDKLKEQSETYHKKHKAIINYELTHSTSIHGAILEYSEKNSSSLIIMGKGSVYEGNMEIPSIGSNTAKIVRHSKVPVITIGNSGHSTEIKSILLPLDLSKETRQKVNWAIKIAKITDAEINVVSALWNNSNKEITNRVSNQMKQVIGFIKKQGVKCSSSIIESKSDKNQKSIIIRYIDKHPELDLVIIMTQQEDDFTEFFVGSSATALIRSIKLPVLSVIPQQLDNIIWGM